MPGRLHVLEVDQLCKLNSRRRGRAAQSDARPDTPGIDADHTPPAVVATVPANGDVDASRANGHHRAVHAEMVGPFNSTDFVVMDGTSQLPGSYTFDAATLTARFTPVPPLLPGGHMLTVNLTSAIMNTTMTPLPAYTFSFTTIDDEAPQLVSSTPLDMATAVPVSSTIVVVFSEPVAGVSTGMTVAQGATAIPGSVVASGDAKTYTFHSDSGAAGGAGDHRVVELRDRRPRDHANALAPTAFSFTTQ